MNKNSLKILGITLSLTMFLLVLGIVTYNIEDPPLKGQNINIEYKIC